MTAQAQIEVKNDTLEMLNFFGIDEGFVFRTFADQKGDNVRSLTQSMTGTFEKCFKALESLNNQGAGIFFTVNATDGKGQKAENIQRIRALFVDFDTPRQQRVHDLLSLDLPPNLIVETSKDKHHAYWVLNPDFGEIALDQFPILQKRLINYFADDGADKSIHDLPRIMRLAGFKHQKGEPFTSRIVHIHEKYEQYAVDDVLNFVKSLPQVEDKKKPTAKQSTLNNVLSAENTQSTDNTAESITHSINFNQSKLLSRGRWHEILAKLGYSVPTNPNGHAPCPICGGEDRFRFDNQNGDGTFICSQGGQGEIAGDGYALLEHAGKTPSEALQLVNGVLDSWGLISSYDATAQKQAHVWGEPEPIKAELLPVQQLARDMLPTDLSEYVFDNAERADHMPNDFVAVSLLTCLGGLIGARVSIKPKQQDDWEIVPNLWGGIVGNPSMKKSPAFNAGSKPLNNLVVKAKAEAKQKKGGVIAMPTDEEREKAKQAIIEKQKIALERASKIKALNATIAYKKTTDEKREKAIAELAEIKAEQEIIEQMQNHADNEAIPEKRYLTNDTSPEALTDLEINNPNGIIIIRDELIGLLSSLTRNGEDTGRAFYLEGWNGTGSYQYDRIVRGAGYIPNHCITLLGGIQPDKLVAYLETTVQGAGNDGLLQRFQLLVYPDAPTWKYEDRYPNKDARSAVYELFEAIDSLKPSDLVKMGAKPVDQYNDRPYFRFSESAQELFINWFTELNAEKIANEEHAIIQEHLSKYGKLMPALALIFHIIDGVNFGNVGAVSKASAEMAIQWCEYLEKHARRIYGLVLNSSELRASTLALKLQQLPIAHEWLSSEGVTASQILRKNWKHLTTIEGVYDALDVLTDKNWLRLEEVEPSAKGGRPKKRFMINKKIFLAKNT